MWAIALTSSQSTVVCVDVMLTRLARWNTKA